MMATLDQLDQDLVELIASRDPQILGRMCTLNHSLLMRLSRARLNMVSRCLRWNDHSFEFQSSTSQTFCAAQTLPSTQVEWSVRIVDSVEKNLWIYMGVCDEETKYAWTIRMHDGLSLTFRIGDGHCQVQRNMPFDTMGCFQHLCDGLQYNVFDGVIRFSLEENGRLWCRMHESGWRLVATFPPNARLRPFVYAPREGDRVRILGYV